MTLRRRWTILLGWLVAVLAGGVLSFHLIDVLHREQILSRSGGDMRLHARLLLRDDHTLPRSCSGAEHEGTRAESTAARLMQAITIAEGYATTRLEHVFEAAVIRTADVLRLPPPDLSVGPGQMKPSTALAALGEAAPGRGTAELPRLLLEPCTNFRVGQRVIFWIAGKKGISLEEPGVEEIQSIARHYNGGDDALSASDVDRALAVQLYGALVYHLYQELTFRTLQDARAE